MKKYWINVSPITGAVYIWKVNKNWDKRLEKEEVLWFDSVMADYLIIKFRELDADKINLRLWEWANAVITLQVEGKVIPSEKI